MKTIKWFVLCLLCFAFTCEINASSKTVAPVVISEIPTGGITISSPGTYVFEKDIQWIPSTNGQAILITANDVTIDMQNHTLYSETTQFSTTGILALLSGNLTIKNGIVANMSYRGVECDGCSNVLIKHMIIDGLNIENTATFTVPVGILVSTSVKAIVQKCTVKNINVRTGSCAAIQMTAVLFSSISKCSIANLLNRDGACTGIGHLACNQAEIKSCTIDGIETQFIDNLNTEGHTAIGIIPTLGTTNLMIKECSVSNVKGCCDDAHGISVFECTNVLVKKCKVENVSDGNGPTQTGAKSTGIEVYGSNVYVISCSVKNISAINPQDRQATGFSCAEGTGIQFIKCHAENVNVYDQYGNQNASLGYGTGFGWAPDPRIIKPAVNVFYKHCKAENCQVGFDSWFHINSIWKNIYSKCNGIDILEQSDSVTRTLSCDACSECGCTFVGCAPTPFSITINNVASNNVFEGVKVKTCKH